jgi:activator of HSP90 ATPase
VSSNAEREKVRDLVKSKIVPQLRTALQQLAPALIAAHGKDIQHTSSNNPAAKPAPSSSASAPPAATQSKSVTSSKGTINTTSLTSNEEFRTSAEQLFSVFTDPQMITAFTRGPPKEWNGIDSGAKFSIFDGNVEGSFISTKPALEIKQQWRLKQWPEGHYSTLSMTFDQNDSEGVTTLRMHWDGVPIGQEDVTKRNWDEYYVKSIKITFGFGTVL